jgi:hypothetical protein
MDEWYNEKILKPKQDWARVSREAKLTKLRNKMSKRDIEREVRIENLGGEPLEILYGKPLSEAERKARQELEWDLKYPKRKEKKKPRQAVKRVVKGSQRTKKQFIEGVLKAIYVRAKRKGIPCNLEHQDVNIPDVCPVLGIPLRWGNGLTDNTPSVDRMIPDLGYVKGNCRVISMKANRLKSNASVEQFKAIVAYMEGKI